MVGPEAVLAQTDLRLDTTWIDYVFVVFYFLLVLGIGVLARRSIASSLDFLLSGRALPAWVTGLAFISANLGAIELIGMMANGAQYGMPTVHYYWIGAIPAMVFLGIVMMPFYYGSKARSVPEFLLMRFNATTQRVNGITFALASVLIAGVNLYALGLILEALLGWSLAIAVPVAALVVLSYTFLGGLNAAIYNEVLQFFVILALLIPLTVAGLARVGGWDGLVAQVSPLPPGPEQLSSWPGTSLTEIANPFLSVLGIVFGLGFVLSFGYWTTNFAEVQRALSARSMSAARRTPIIGAFPKALIPLVIVIPGMIAGVLVPQLTTLKQGGETDVTYNNALSLLMNEVLPNGILGVALAGLLASFMAGMAANVSSLNTVFTYDLWQDWIRPGRPDEYYLRVGRTVTVAGCLLAIGTAFIAGSFENLMDYIQALFSFFNAPLFAIFILGLFWKRMTGTAGWTGLIGGTLAAVIVDTLVRTEVIAVSSQAGSFIGASAAFVVGIAVAAVVTQFTTSKPDSELVGLVWALTPRGSRAEAVETRVAPSAAGEAGAAAPHGRPATIEEVPTSLHDDEGAWWQSPAVMGTLVLVLTAVLYLIFA
ncbi:MAG TPA: sodium:solute symporter family protein [Pseudonocardia sp.]|jgi:SSS family solute:Na+ symporter|uniref:sodium:solute symporter family protein n=1 Tax=Pseudonocardia sp. TaxID=60912 RepID=UPI002B4AD18C|nr:sodium:solute symporter family protein [Pseudonocardia sp.]HLU58571.1 sodium:solute symporter family protein [Pseudonocardia sp.]